MPNGLLSFYLNKEGGGRFGSELLNIIIGLRESTPGSSKLPVFYWFSWVGQILEETGTALLKGDFCILTFLFVPGVWIELELLNCVALKTLLPPVFYLPNIVPVDLKVLSTSLDAVSALTITTGCCLLWLVPDESFLDVVLNFLLKAIGMSLYLGDELRDSIACDISSDCLLVSSIIPVNSSAH